MAGTTTIICAGLGHARLKEITKAFNGAYGPYMVLEDENHVLPVPGTPHRIVETYTDALRRHGARVRIVEDNDRILGGIGTLLEDQMDAAQAILDARAVADEVRTIVERIARLASGDALEVGDKLREAVDDKAAEAWMETAVGSLEKLYEVATEARNTIAELVHTVSEGGTPKPSGSFGSDEEAAEGDFGVPPPRAKKSTGPEESKEDEEFDETPEIGAEKKEDDDFADFDLSELGSEEQESEGTTVEPSEIADKGEPEVMRRRMKTESAAVRLKKHFRGKARRGIVEARRSLMECAACSRSGGTYRPAVVFRFGPVVVALMADGSFIEHDTMTDEKQAFAPAHRLMGVLGKDEMDVAAAPHSDEPDTMVYAMSDGDETYTVRYNPVDKMVGGSAPRAVKECFARAVRARIDEKWGKETRVPPSERGKWSDYTVDELCSKYRRLLAGKRVMKDGKPADIREIIFAIRAKTGWGSAKKACGISTKRKRRR